jgi:hypothetical protein
MDIEVGGLLGLLILIADIWALVHVLGSTASVGAAADPDLSGGRLSDLAGVRAARRAGSLRSR